MLSILVVDEDRLFKDLLIRTLTSETCTVIEASSIVAAKTVIVDQQPNLVIVDAHLSEATLFIFSLQSAHVPVIALVNTDQRRDQLQLAEIRVVDRRGSLAALIDSIRSATTFDVSAGTDSAHHVLIVDDEEGIRALLSQFLRQHGYVTSGARDGIEALRMLDGGPKVSVVLLDVAMPRSGGLETLGRIMKRKPHPGVIMLSGLADTLVVERAMKLGAFGYIVKPLDLSEVESTVSACIACSEMAS